MNIIAVNFKNVASYTHINKCLYIPTRLCNDIVLYNIVICVIKNYENDRVVL